MAVDARFLSIVIGVSVGVVVFRPTWRIARYAVTAVHELGHLITAVALGGRAARVRLRFNTSGLTTCQTAAPGRVRAGFTALAGPAFPPFVGAGCALAFDAERVRLGVVVLAILLIVIAVVVRNVWGWVVIAALAALVVWAWRDGAGGAQVLMVVAATVLCLGGVRAVAEEMTPGPDRAVRDTQIAANNLRLSAGLWGSMLMLWALAWTGFSTWRITLALYG